MGVFIMVFSLAELRGKEVINIDDGRKLGFIDEAEFDSVGGGISSLVIYGGAKFLGIFGKEEDIVIPFSDIDLIGIDTILIKKHNAVHLTQI
jgi:YlmC/YmxH family sporulation protein